MTTFTKLALVGILLVVIFSMCGAAFTLATGTAAQRVREVQAALGGLEDTARQSGAAVCAGVVVAGSCNLTQTQEKQTPAGGGPALPVDVWFMLFLVAGVVCIFGLYGLAVMAGYGP